MRLPNAAHESGSWRIRAIASDLALEDVWALPVHGGAEDFQALLDLMVSSNPAHATSVPTRLLWQARDLLGRWFDLGRISAPVDGATAEDDRSLADSLPEDLRGTADDVHFQSLPFTPVYRTDVEFAAELSNRTVHAVMHLAWVEKGAGRYQGQMAVYVKPRGLLGAAYMAFIKPFRYVIVYPALMRQIEQAWRTRDLQPAGASG